MVAAFWRNRSLVASLVRREVVGRYRGSALGMLWSFFHPILILAVYTFVFSVVFRLRWGIPGETSLHFALVLLAGMLPYNLFAECVGRAPSLVLANANYVKKVVFPLEVLPYVALGSALFHLLASLSAWLAFHLVFFGIPKPTTLLLPVVMVPLLLLVLGLAWMLASLGVFLRDVAQNIGVVLLALHFLSPVFYPLSAIPQEFRWLIGLNPLTPILESVRAVMIWGIAPDWSQLPVHCLMAAAFAWLGFAWFQKTRAGFADVL
jgi:lipopolysaccharide transport system permease protein